MKLAWKEDFSKQNIAIRNIPSCNSAPHQKPAVVVPTPIFWISGRRFAQLRFYEVAALRRG